MLVVKRVKAGVREEQGAKIVKLLARVGARVKRVNDALRNAPLQHSTNFNVLAE